MEGSGAGQNKTPKVKRGILTGISTNVLVLGIVSLLTDMSSEMIYPIMPLFLTGIGASALVIGLIEGASETTASLVKVASGWYSDRFRKRKPFILGGYCASSFVKPLLYFATSPWHVLGLKITERIGKGVRSAPRDALIADSTDKGYRGRAFGLHKALDSLGAVIGPLLVIPILLAAATVTVDTYRFVFLVSTVPALAAVLVIILFVREKQAEGEGRVGRFFKELQGLGRAYYKLLLVVVTFYLGEISYVFFVLKASDAGVTLFDAPVDVSVILLYVLFNITFVAVAILAGDLSDRWGRKPIVAVSFGWFILACAVMSVAELLPALIVGFVLLGVYKGASEGVLKAYVTDVAPKKARATALGGFHTAVGLVMLPGGVIAGFLWDSSLGPAGTFGFGAAMSAVALVLLLLIAPNKDVQIS